MADVKNKSVNIYINSDAAEQALANLQKRADALNKKIEEGRAAGKNMNAEIKRLAETEQAIKGVQEQIDKGLRPSFVQTESQVKKLRNELKRMSEDAPGYAAKFEEYKAKSAVFDEMKAKINGVAVASKEMGGAISFAIANFVSNVALVALQKLKESITNAAHASDQLASIRRISGLTAQEVDNLNQKLSDIDTRTSLDGLREIAAVAGRLGVKKEDIADFTKQLDRLGVVFHGELGDVDTIASQLGKIVNVFDGRIDGENVSRLGNAIVGLSHSGPSTAGFLSDFTQRLSGIAKVSNLSLSAVLGLGAGIEETGGRVESGATAIQKILIKIAENVPKAAKIAGQDVQKFAEDFAKTPEKALLAYAKGLQANKQTFAETTSAFKDAGEDGARVITTLATLGQKTDYFQQRIDLAYKKAGDTHDLEHAADIMNNSLGASIDKLGKAFSALGNSTSVQRMLKGIVDTAISFINVLKAIPGFIKNNETAFALMAIGIATMNAGYIKAAVLIARDTALKIYNATVTRLTAVATNIAIAAQAAYIEITNFLTTEIKLATTAQRLWNIALSLGAGPIGAIIVAAGALFLIVGNLVGAFHTVAAEQKLFNEIQAKAAEDISSQKASIDTLTNAINNNSLSLDERKKALNGLISINPAYLSGLTLENTKTAEGKKLIDDYVSSLDRMARAKATQSLKEDLYKKEVEATVKAQRASLENAPTSAVGLTVQTGLIATGFGGFTGLGKSLKANDDVVKSKADISALNAVTQKEIAEENKLIDIQEKKMQSLKVDSVEYKNEQVKLNDLVATRNVLMGLENVALTTGTSNLNTGVKTTSGIIDKLKSDIKDLDDKLGALTTKGDIKINREQRKKLQDELDALEGKGADKKAKKEENEQEKLIKQLKDFQFELSQIGKNADESEISRITKKYEELIDKAKKFHLQYVGLEVEKNRAIAFLHEKEMKAKRDKFEKDFIETAKNEYQNQLVLLSEYIDQQKDQEAKKYADGLISKAEYDANIRFLEAESIDEQIRIDKDYASTVKDAAKNLSKDQKEQRKENLKEAVANAELIQSFEKQSAASRAKAAVVLAKDGTREKLDAEKNQLKLEYDEEVKNLQNKKAAALVSIKIQYQEELQLLIEQLETKRKIELALVDPNDPEAEKKKNDINGRFDTAEKAGTDDIEKRKSDAISKLDSAFSGLFKDAFALFQKQTGDLEKKFWLGKVEEYLGYASSALDILSKFNDAKVQKENAALNNELKANDRRRKSIEQLERQKVLSAQEAQRRIKQIDLDEEKAKEDLAKKQGARAKKIAIAQAIINGAMAITSTLAAIPGPIDILTLGAARAISIGLAIATTATQIATIASQKFADGGQVQPEKMKNGKITTEPNIPAQPNGDNVLATVKVGEVILNEEQQKALGGAATFRAIGVPGFAGGGTVKPFWKNRPFERINFPKVNQAQKEIRQFATGGLVKAANATASAAGQISASIETQKNEVAATDPALLETLHLLGNTVAQLKKRLDDGIEASVSLKKLDDARALKNRILNDASMK